MTKKDIQNAEFVRTDNGCIVLAATTKNGNMTAVRVLSEQEIRDIIVSYYDLRTTAHPSEKVITIDIEDNKTLALALLDNKQ